MAVWLHSPLRRILASIGFSSPSMPPYLASNKVVVPSFPSMGSQWSKYQDSLLTTTAADGQDCAFPVAFAVVDAESGDNWHWFLLQLKSALSTSIPITFVADRQKGLSAYISEAFVGSYHGYCLRYLSEQLIEDLKRHFSLEVKHLLVEDLYAVVHATQPDDFVCHLESIKSISVEAYDWIIQVTHRTGLMLISKERDTITYV